MVRRASDTSTGTPSHLTDDRLRMTDDDSHPSQMTDGAERPDNHRTQHRPCDEQEAARVLSHTHTDLLLPDSHPPDQIRGDTGAIMGSRTAGVTDGVPGKAFHVPGDNSEEEIMVLVLRDERMTCA